MIVFRMRLHDKGFGALFVSRLLHECSFMTNIRLWEGGKGSKGGQESGLEITYANIELWFVFTLAVG